VAAKLVRVDAEAFCDRHWAAPSPQGDVEVLDQHPVLQECLELRVCEQGASVSRSPRSMSVSLFGPVFATKKSVSSIAPVFIEAMGLAHTSGR
jgi:hypothetical protein